MMTPERLAKHSLNKKWLKKVLFVELTFSIVGLLFFIMSIIFVTIKSLHISDWLIAFMFIFGVTLPFIKMIYTKKVKLFEMLKIYNEFERRVWIYYNVVSKKHGLACYGRGPRNDLNAWLSYFYYPFFKEISSIKKAINLIRKLESEFLNEIPIYGKSLYNLPVSRFKDRHYEKFSFYMEEYFEKNGYNPEFDITLDDYSIVEKYLEEQKNNPTSKKKK